MLTMEDIRGHLNGTQKATSSTQGVLGTVHGGIDSGALSFRMWRAEAPIEQTAAQQADTCGWITMGFYLQDIVGPHLRRRG